MLAKVKLALRITCNSFDDEINGIISAAFDDLSISGISFEKEKPDALIVRAIVLYSKANFGVREDAERSVKAYENLKVALMLAVNRIEDEVMQDA